MRLAESRLLSCTQHGRIRPWRPRAGSDAPPGVLQQVAVEGGDGRLVHDAADGHELPPGVRDDTIQIASGERVHRPETGRLSIQQIKRRQPGTALLARCDPGIAPRARSHPAPGDHQQTGTGQGRTLQHARQVSPTRRYGNQLGLTFPIFEHYLVQLWVPEVGGAVDPGSDAHELVMALYGGMSKGERNRIKIRVRSAMEGRFLGGRPPYGYRLTDAGPHPNPSKAADGKRLHRLQADPNTAPVVQRFYREYLTGTGIYAIAERLTRDGILSPSAAEPARNTHRHVPAWGKSAIRVILTNPRYTGRLVWNKQRKTEILIDVDDVAPGHETKMRWNPTQQWVYSSTQAHEALIDHETFERVQTMIAAGARGR